MPENNKKVSIRRIKGAIDHPCITDGCDGHVGGSMPKGTRGARGLCKRCHNEASSLIKRGITTWQELERLGLAQPTCGSFFEHILRIAREERDSRKKMYSVYIFKIWVNREHVGYVKAVSELAAITKIRDGLIESAHVKVLKLTMEQFINELPVEISILNYIHVN